MFNKETIAALREFVRACENEAIEEAVDAGFGVNGKDVMIVFHPLYEQYTLCSEFLNNIDGVLI